MISTYPERSITESKILSSQIDILQKCLMCKIVKTSVEVDVNLKADLQNISGKILIGCRTRDIKYYIRYGDITFRKSEVDMMLQDRSVISNYLYCWHSNDKIVKWILLSGKIVKEIIKQTQGTKIQNSEGNCTTFFTYTIETLKYAMIDSNI